MNSRFVIYYTDSAGAKRYYTACPFKPWMAGLINALVFETKEAADEEVARTSYRYFSGENGMVRVGEVKSETV